MDRLISPITSQCETPKLLPLCDRSDVEESIAVGNVDSIFISHEMVHPTVSVIIPTLNEAANLPHVLPRIPPWVHEVILVDGNSTDKTVEIAQQLWKGIRIVQQQGRGKGAALRSGFAAATGDIIVMLDADGSMNPSEIPVYIGALLTGADFAKGSRFLQGGGTEDMEWLRYLGNLALTGLVRLCYGGQYSDLCYGFNAFWRRVLYELKLDADGFEIETQMNVRILQANLRISEVPSFEARRIHGVSNLNTFRDGWRVLKTIVTEWLTPQVTKPSETYPLNKLPHPNFSAWMPFSAPVSASQRLSMYRKDDRQSVGIISEG